MKIKRNETYGLFIKRIRQTAKLRQVDLALRLGFTSQTISNWERGRVQPPPYSQKLIDEFAKTIKSDRRDGGICYLHIKRNSKARI
jgi:DNA-binding transcriptional regulator YiaG